MNIENYLKTEDFILTEGAIVERLKNEFGIKVDSFINHAGTIYDNPKELSYLYEQYIDIAQKYGVPIMLMTPTRRVNFETLRKSKYHDRSIIPDSVDFLIDIKKQYAAFSNKIFIGGLLGCKGDAFQGESVLGIEESYEFHKVQVSEFKMKGVDYLFAGIMPNINEAIGMARAMADSGIPYIISFSIRKNGYLLDGTSIVEAIEKIEGNVKMPPIGYMANCIHPANLKYALESEPNAKSNWLSRFIGIQANASSLSPEELNNSGVLKQESFEDMIQDIVYLKNKYHLKVLGGCCGTNHVFIEDLARNLVKNLD